MSTWSLLVVLSISALSVIVWPLARMWWQTGIVAFVGHRGSEPIHRVTGLGFGALVATGAAYATAYGALGADAFGGRPPTGPLSWMGLVVIASALVWMGIAQSQMGHSWRIGIDDRPTEVVARGLYRLVRHPIYSGLLLWLVGVVLFAPTPLLMLGAGAVLWVLSLQARLEEQHMLTVNGAAYRERMESVGRFVPGIGRDLSPVPSPTWLALSAALSTVALLDLLQIVWRPWVPKHAGALAGALLYLALAHLAGRGHRLGALIPIFVPLLPISILLLSAAGVSVGVTPDAPMRVILVVQIAAALLGARLVAR